MENLSYDRLLAASGLPRLEARALLESATALSREWLVAHGDELAPPPWQARFEALAHRRRSGEPLAYLTGSREFLGRRFAVSPAVLIPRPETEELVQRALHRIRDKPRPRVADLGTGSGVIAISLALARPDASLVATDLSREALALAQENARRLGVSSGIEWRLGSWGQALACGEDGQTRVGEPFDLIVSNPPYLAQSDPHLHDPGLQHEPRGALVSGPDGLESIRAVIELAGTWLVSGGWVLIEHGHGQGEAVSGLLRVQGLCEVACLRDAAGVDRIGEARKP